MDIKENIIEALFAFITDIQYAAVFKDKEFLFKQRQEIADHSSGETDKYEELLVNPTLVRLAIQRGDKDCGGAHWVRQEKFGCFS